MAKCPHGCEIGAHGGVTLMDLESCESEADEIQLLQFYSACDCCDVLMHHDTCGEGYEVLDDGRTLCSICALG